MQNRKQKLVFGYLATLFFINILVWTAVYNLNRHHFLEVIFFNVGQGDAIFIQTPQLHQIIIDGGPDSTILEKLAKEMPLWDRTIDLIILTHPESDHLAGLIEVLKRYRVENILWTGIIRDTAEYKEWLKLIEKEKAKIFISKIGQKVSVKETILEILYPTESLKDKNFKDSNNTSIVAKLFFGNNSFLFTGDIYNSVENKLIKEEINLDSDILKISHHGSKTSSINEFLEKVSPNIAIISLNKDNKYGHPHQEVLERLEKYDIKTLRTDLDGDIRIISDGKNLKIISNGKN